MKPPYGFTRFENACWWQVLLFLFLASSYHRKEGRRSTPPTSSALVRQILSGTWRQHFVVILRESTRTSGCQYVSIRPMYLFIGECGDLSVHPESR